VSVLNKKHSGRSQDTKKIEKVKHITGQTQTMVGRKDISWEKILGKDLPGVKVNFE